MSTSGRITLVTQLAGLCLYDFWYINNVRAAIYASYRQSGYSVWNFCTNLWDVRVRSRPSIGWHWHWRVGSDICREKTLTDSARWNVRGRGVGLKMIFVKKTVETLWPRPITGRLGEVGRLFKAFSVSTQNDIVWYFFGNGLYNNNRGGKRGRNVSKGLRRVWCE